MTFDAGLPKPVKHQILQVRQLSYIILLEQVYCTRIINAEHLKLQRLLHILAGNSFVNSSSASYVMQSL